MLSVATEPDPSREAAEVKFEPRVPPEVLATLAEVLESAQDEAEPSIALRDDDLRRRLDAVARGEAAAAQAARLLLADLIQHGWTPRIVDGQIWLRRPAEAPAEGEAKEDFKRRQREALRLARLRQLGESSVRVFLRRMESSRSFGGRRASVLDLVDDGRSLALALAEVAQLPPSERGEALARVVNPVVEVASATSTCPHTGLVTLDIWRYFRHTWSIEYRPTPGRTLCFLIRNAARPRAPVMGIACLANATLQLKVRDNWVGWTVPEIIGRLRDDSTSAVEILEALLRTLCNAKAEIRTTDLMKQVGRVRGEELERKLEQLARDALEQRKDLLEEHRRRKERGEAVEPLKNLPRFGNGEYNWREASESPLFVAKRARALADMLYAERVLTKYVGCEQSLVESLIHESSPESMKLQRALNIAAREIRKVGLASRMLDLSVCGAVQPYRDLLVGKLVALAVAGAEVADEYAARYRGQVSEIASQMAGRAVSRDPSACVITTTSIYAVVASQYNRLKLRLGADRVLHWEEIERPIDDSEDEETVPTTDKRAEQSQGKRMVSVRTAGKGTGHISEDTLRALRALTTERSRRRNVNNVFGEGQSPRLRQVREGLTELRLDPEVYLCHSMPRRVYGLELFPGARRTLCLNQPANGVRVPFAEIARGWRARWLEPRISNREVLARVAEAGPESVRAELTAPETGPQRSLFPIVEGHIAGAPSSSRQTPERIIIMAKKSNPSFVQSLYRALSACADHHTPDELAQIHIETAVESFIKERAQGRVMLVTGNPGDGKTHLLRRLAEPLKAAKVEVCLDANESSDSDLTARIEGAFQRGRGLVIAINEGILAHLVRSAGTRPWAMAARQQMLHPLVYREIPPLDDRLLVVDLNLRNTLAPDVVRKALEQLVRLGAPCAECPRQGCEFVENVRRISEAGVDGVVALLDSVARSGVHATMRDLYGFLSFLLAGPRTCRQIQGAPDDGPRMYWNNAFIGGRGPLFDAVREFDPRLQSSPLLDDLLWRGADRPEDWHLPNQGRPSSPLDPLRDHVDIFVERKRRALFEHKRGLSLLSHAGSGVDRELQELLKTGQSAVRRVTKLINRFFDRDDNEQGLLRLWVTHRYDAGSSRYAAAAAWAPTTDLEILVPRLHPGIEAAFPGYLPDHVVLRDKQSGPDEGLRIDRTLLEALLDAERGLPTSFQRGEPGVRIASFLDKLAKRFGDLANEREIEVHLVDRDTGNNLRVEIDVEGRRFVRAGTR